MEEPGKLYLNSPKRNDNKQTFKIEDQLWQRLSPSVKVKVNGLEKHPSKAFEHQKFPSLHEALGPALTGFLCLIPPPPHVEN